jgi:hypothetical protein
LTRILFLLLAGNAAAALLAQARPDLSGVWKLQSTRARLSLQNIPIDLQSLKLINFRLLLRLAQQHLFNVLGALASMFKTSSQLRLENLALRQQLAVLRRSAPKRLKLTPADRIFWVWLRRVWGDWKSVLTNPGGQWRTAHR